MKKIMFVCLGNICRSPLAHATFEKIVQRENALGRYGVDSSGTTAYHAGEEVDPRMRAVAVTYGIEIDHRAQQLTRDHIEEFDLVVCMDSENRKNALVIAKKSEQKKKIVMLRDFDPKGRGDVPDPYYGGENGFHEVVKIVMRSCEMLYTHLEEAR